MDVIAGVDEGPLQVLPWLIQFWHEAADFVHFGSVAVWVISALLEVWLADARRLGGGFLIVLFLVQTVVHHTYW